jgi:hypothetical protein
MPSKNGLRHGMATEFQLSRLCAVAYMNTVIILVDLGNRNTIFEVNLAICTLNRWSQRPRGLRRKCTAACLLRSWVRIPPGAWMFVCCVCCVLSGRGLCDELITRSEQSYRLWRVVVCDQETS